MKALTPTKPAAPRIPGVYVWEVPGKPISIRLSLDVVDRMQQEVMRGFGAVPKRGAEVGGILMGSVKNGDTTIVNVDDFVPVTIEYKRGPSYLLSEDDRQTFGEAVAQARTNSNPLLHAIGYFRSHTREGVGLSPEDIGILDTHFPDAAAVALLIRPYASKVSQAGFYFRQDGRFTEQEPTLLEFPFRRRELEGGPAPPRASDRMMQRQSPGERREPVTTRTGAAEPPQEASPRTPDVVYTPARIDSQPPAAASAVPPPDDEMKPKARAHWMWIPLSFILLLLLGFFLGFEGGISMRPQLPAGSNDPFNLGLTVTKSGDNLQVRWDRQALAIRTAQRGTLTIEEGPTPRPVELDPLQLQNGSVVYRYYSNHVRFRLEVFPKERDSVAEVIDWKQ